MDGRREDELVLAFPFHARENVPFELVPGLRYSMRSSCADTAVARPSLEAEAARSLLLLLEKEVDSERNKVGGERVGVGLGRVAWL